MRTRTRISYVLLWDEDLVFLDPKSHFPESSIAGIRKRPVVLRAHMRTPPVGGVVQGLLGVQPTSPGYRSFTVKPRLGSLKRLALKLPTLYGYINVTATPARLALQVPCNSRARACLLASVAEAPVVLVDGVAADHVREGLHVCAVAPLGCGVAGTARILELR